MASKYFTSLSFARAKKNKEELEKTNPQEPVLKDEDEKFLNQKINSEDTAAASQEAQDAPTTKITDDGEEKEASKEEEEQARGSPIVPETQPGAGGDTDAKPETEDTTKEEEPKPETKPESGDGAQDAEQPKEKAESIKSKKSKKKNDMDLPSQEEAEAATRGFNEKAAQEAEQPQGEKKTWASYIPTSVRPSSRKGAADASTEQQPGSPSSPTQDKEKDSRTWTQVASSYVPNMPSIPDSWRPKSRDKDSQPEPVYNEDGTINEDATKEKQEKEVSVLLDNLNLSAINNRVFAFSLETQKIYERFALVLKDMINGAPTAYDDMDNLMKEAGPKLEQQFKSMPPFVQTLVKSLPMKLGSTLGPELMAAASEKPGADMRARMEAASKPGAGGASNSGGINLPSSSTTDTTEKNEDGTTKKKGRIPGMKSLMATNAAAVLMFVFWYCHKRGKEVRLAREAEEAGEGEDVDDDVLEVEVSDEDEDAEKGEGSGEEDADVEEGLEEDEKLEKEVNEKADALSQPNPAEVPLPERTEEKGAELEAEKATGV